MSPLTLYKNNSLLRQKKTDATISNVVVPETDHKYYNESEPSVSEESKEEEEDEGGRGSLKTPDWSHFHGAILDLDSNSTHCSLNNSPLSFSGPDWLLLISSVH